jgi:hypothetical protein
VELPYGGGIGFATGRRSPLYSNQFALFMPPREIQQRDLDRIRARPPRVVIAMDAPHFGTYYGVEANVGCEFPRLVWMPNRPAGDAAYVLPVVRFISEHYRVSARFGPWLILTPAFDQPMRR